MSIYSESISALLPVRNAQDHLGELVPSILQMLCPFDQLIIINDGSTDDSLAILKKFQQTDERIILINTGAVGIVDALNRGLAKATNDWVARFDADDQYSDQRLLEQKRMISAGTALIFSDYRFISRGGRNLGRVCSAVTPNAMALSLISSQRAAHPVALINRRFLTQCGGYDNADYPAEDLALWLKLSKLGDIVSWPSILLSYRISKGSISSQNRKIQLLRKHNIIDNFDSWGNFQHQSLLELEETLGLYKKMPNSMDRIYLHLRDLHLVSKYTGLRIQPKFIFEELGISLTFKLVIAGLRIGLLTIFRRIYRFSGICK